MTALLPARDHVVQDELIAAFVLRQRPIEFLNARRSFLIPKPERGVADHQAVTERPSPGLAARVDYKASRAELHFDDRMQSVASVWGGR